MSATVFKNLGKFMSYEEKVISKGRPNKIVIKYTQPKYQDPSKVWEVGEFEDKISDALLAKIVSLSSGEEVCIHTAKNEKGFSDLVDITDAKDVPTKGGFTRPQLNKSSQWQPKDESGIAVGAAWTNAIEILKMEGGPSAGEDTVEIVARIAEQVLRIKLEQEDRLRASKLAKVETSKPSTQSTPSASAKKTTQSRASRLAEAKAKSTTEPPIREASTDDFDDFDDIIFDEL
jgi:hypothetical protein